MNRVLALGLLLASSIASADLCTGTCSITMDFANGGTLQGQGATVTFGTGGSLVLGTGGSLSLGVGGSITPNVDPPDMSAGGTIVFGEGGTILFGTGGSLDTGTGGGITVGAGGSVSVDDAVDVTVDSSQDVHLGALATDGTASVTAGGSITDLDTTTSIHFNTTGSLNIVAARNVTYAAITGATLELDDNSDDPRFSDCSAGCPGGTPGTIGLPSIPTESNTFSPGTPGAGAFGWLTLLPLALLGLRRRR